MKIETKIIKLSKIKLNPENPRLIKDDKFNKLKKSIEEFPEMKSIREIVVDENMIILGGNMRFRAMQDLGIKETTVKIVSELTESQKKEFIIKDNVGFGEWDWDIIANEWNNEPYEEWGLELPVKFDDTINNDIEEVREFNEGYNFTIKCKNIDEFEELCQKLDTTSTKMDYTKFIIKSGL